MKTAKIILAASASLAFAAIAFCALQIAFLVRQTQASEIELQKTAGAVLAHMDATVTDLDRTVQIAGGAIGEARKIERDNRSEIAAVNHQTVLTMQHVNELIQSIDASQKQAASSIAQTSGSMVPVIQQAQRDLADLQPAIQQVTPLLQRTTDIAVNLSNTTADVQHEIHKFVYPPPRKWYQKYFLDPAKTLAHLVTIPVR